MPTVTVGIATLVMLASMAVAASAEVSFNYRTREFCEVPTELLLPDFPPFPQYVGDLREAIGVYLHGDCKTQRWMDAYGTAFYGGAEVEHLLSERATSGNFREEPRQRCEHLIRLRAIAAQLIRTRPEKREYITCAIASKWGAQRTNSRGKLGNPPRSIPEGVKAPDGELSLVLNARDLASPDGTSRGMALYLVNKQDSGETFTALSGSYMPLECDALGPDGLWHPIGPQHVGWCGNGIRQISLRPGECWKLAVKELDGDYETKVRYRLERSGKPAILSNETVMRIPKAFLEPERLRRERGGKSSE